MNGGENNGGGKEFLNGQPIAIIEPPPAYSNNDPRANYPQQQWQPIQSQPQSQMYPPPYSGQNFEMQQMQFGMMPTSMPGPAYNELMASVENELRQHSEMILTSAGRIDEGMSLIQIQDRNGRTIYNVQIQQTSRVVSATNQNVQTAQGAIYTVCDSSGTEVMRVQQETASMHASMMGRALGFVQNQDYCSTSFTACNTTGGSTFHIEGADSCSLACCPCGTTPKFGIKTNGEQIGGMESHSNPGGGSCAISFPQQLDINSKALLMTAAIMIYIGYFGKTRCGTSGARGCGCICAWCICGFNIILMLVVPAVVLLVVLGS